MQPSNKNNLNNKAVVICCFGEVLLRFSPQLNGQFIEQASMPVYVGGAELNVATALANWGLKAKYITAVPDNYLAREIIASITQRNIDASQIQYGGERIGSYYLPQGTDLKNNGVIYDRAHSSFAGLKPGSLNWDALLEGVGWFHFSAISPALNEAAAAVCLEALQAAAKKNITISVDLNYRAKLWQYGKLPVDIMPALVQYCHVIMGNIWSAETLLGMPLSRGFKNGHGNKNIYLQEAALVAKAIQQAYPNCHTIANTFRFDAGEGIEYFATLHTAETSYSSATYSTENIVDKVGSGDCFMAGLIYGLTQKLPFQNIVEFAAAAAFCKLQQMGDATTSKINDVQKIMQTNG